MILRNLETQKNMYINNAWVKEVIIMEISKYVEQKLNITCKNISDTSVLMLNINKIFTNVKEKVN